jgi:hypothetical protein
MEGTKKHSIAIIISLFALILLIFAFGATMLRCTKDTLQPKIAPIQCNCDSLNSTIQGLYIDNGRYEIIMDRLYEKDSTIYNEITTNLE